VSPHELVAEVAVSTLAKFPSILACVLIALAGATCGSLALCLGSFCYFLKLFKMYQEYLEGLVKRAVGLRDEDDPAILLGVNFQFTLALLWVINTVLHFPVLITWTQNIQFAGATLSPDPSFIPAVLMSLSLAVIWQNDAQPKVEKKYFSIVAIILQGGAICIASFCLVNMYRLTYIITAVFVVVALHQLFSPNRDEPEEVEDEDSKDGKEDTNGDFSDRREKAEKSQSHSRASQDGSADSCTDSEYEYEYKVNLVKRKVSKSRSDSNSITETDTGLGTESLEWDDDKTCNDLNSTSEDLEDKKDA